MKYVVQIETYDERGELISLTVCSTVFNSLGEATRYMDWLADRTRKDDNPLTVGWQDELSVRTLEQTGTVRIASYGSN